MHPVNEAILMTLALRAGQSSHPVTPSGGDASRDQGGPPVRAGESRYSYYAFFLLLAIACGWILSLPTFPSQDGPVHVYYARIALELLHGPTQYSTEYRIARLFPPYSLHAYLLMGALEAGVSPEGSEKLLAIISLLLGGLGFWYFARQIGRSANIAAIFALPLLLNRYFFFGLYAYWLGIAVGFFAAGLWLRSDRRKPARRALFVVLVVLSLFGHPIPFLLVLGFCWTELAAGWWHQHRGGGGQFFTTPTSGDVVTLVVVSGLLGYVKMYSNSGALWESYSAAALKQNAARILDVFNGSLLAPLTSAAYGYGIGAIIAAAALLACSQTVREMRSGRFTRAQLVLAWALLFLVALPLLPEKVNGGFLFADRITIWVALMLVAAAANSDALPRFSGAVAALGSITAVSLLLALNAQMRPVAQMLALRGLPRLSQGEHLFAVNNTPNPQFTYNPFLWTGVRVIEAERAFLENSPWLLTSIMMLEKRPVAVTVAGRPFGDYEFTGRPAPTGVPVAGGIVLTNCGNAQTTNSLGQQMLAEAPTAFRLWKFGCYEVLEPLPLRTVPVR